jgi:hypothetical protein
MNLKLEVHKLRYIRDPQNTENVIDMRHMLIMGANGPAVGNTVEVGQWLTPGNRSGMDPQDFYSNDLQYRFYEHLSQNNLNPNSLMFVKYLYDFLTTRTDPE